MMLKTIEAENLTTAKSIAHELYGNDIVILETNIAERGPTRITIAVNKAKTREIKSAEVKTGTYLKQMQRLVDEGVEKFQKIIDTLSESKHPYPVKEQSSSSPKESTNFSHMMREQALVRISALEQRIEALEKALAISNNMQKQHMLAYPEFRYLHSIQFPEELLSLWYEQFIREGRKSSECEEFIKTVIAAYYELKQDFNSQKIHIFLVFDEVEISSLITDLNRFYSKKGAVIYFYTLGLKAFAEAGCSVEAFANPTAVTHAFTARDDEQAHHILFINMDAGKDTIDSETCELLKNTFSAKIHVLLNPDANPDLTLSRISDAQIKGLDDICFWSDDFTNRLIGYTSVYKQKLKLPFGFLGSKSITQYSTGLIGYSPKFWAELVFKAFGVFPENQKEFFSITQHQPHKN